MSKYRNVKCEHQGQRYDSKRERDRHIDLMLLERAGQITDLRRQVAYELAPRVKLGGRFKPALRYFADFTYTENGASVTEDVKGGGRVTEAFRIKAHLMATVHGIEIRLT